MNPADFNFSDSIFIFLLFSTVRMSLPLVLTATGGYFSEKSGVAQIGLEAFLLIGAFTASAVTFLTNSLLLGYVTAALSSVLLAQIFCFLVLRLKANSIVVGTGLNLFVVGLIPLIGKTVFDSTGSTPSIPLFDNAIIFPTVTIIFALVLSFYLSEKTVWGLQVKFAGEKQAALSAIGVNASTRQWQAISYGAFITGLGGAILSTYLASSYSPLMSAGRGYIALAAIIFAGWDLRKTILISVLFGFFEALQIQAQSSQRISELIPGEFIQMIPYLITILALLFFKTKRQAPKELK
jgi:ABC-type uncharacterized transport system permease subunit